MSYQIKEVFYSLQGEGVHTGRPAIFCRFSQCNLWTGREQDRNNAICSFCDTDFVGTDGQNGGRFEDAQALTRHLLSFWPTSSPQHPFVVLTGGEPLLQVDQALINEMHQHQVEIAIETNGTKLPPDGIDWICVSPKAGAPWILTEGDELKLVYPQVDLLPNKIPLTGFKHFYLQPMDGDQQSKNLQSAIKFCLQHPEWKLSLQTHKIMNID
ncbi:7-carboxy-7-deazaguanine synthase [Thiomicrospira pelophila]|uniref:7-carboxy-7-deazaguanine synthase n=1 Tax=Thiomicrospira pelophila TaxID=934 RepID=UPI0004A6CF21|nr:7-carboxy-7-deazaguanine synthase [Thiomicrospira pelophila]